jgi:hypothetical protein
VFIDEMESWMKKFISSFLETILSERGGMKAWADIQVGRKKHEPYLSACFFCCNKIAPFREEPAKTKKNEESRRSQ